MTNISAWKVVLISPITLQMGFDWLKNKRNQQKQMKEKFLSQKSEIRSEKITANVFAHNELGLHVSSHS